MYSDSEPTSLCSFSLLLRAERKNNKYQFYFTVFGLTRPGLEPTIYRIRGEHAANHYATDVVGTSVFENLVNILKIGHFFISFLTNLNKRQR
jgi:hypothetical protein